MDIFYFFSTGFDHWTWGQVFAVIFANDVLRNVVLIAGLFGFVTMSKYAQRKKIYRLPFSKGQLASEFKWAIPTLVFDSLYFTFLVKSGIALRDESNFLATFAFTFVWFEIWFYISHRALHHPKLYFIHRQHHVAKVTSPLTSLSFSVAERAILQFGGFLPSVALSFFMPISYMAIAAYLIVNLALTMYIHLNVEIYPKWMRQSRLFNWINPVTHHALHHSRYLGHYGLYTPFLDRWFKTEFKDFDQVYKRAADGEGMESLNQRLSSEPRQAA